ncbi:helix-turn-helix transcriptional regulator [Roseburia sp. 1XD42-69]|uniref:helix-turn-helix transcriptional regulator n=1 Tax=Roseburia sp. 1XD42-69 TaxID=2320088 RepID=UPI000EA17969|nr:helix-turn-helix transcriptional regulator [Roseburia sp. 1XD42-69]RKJ66866.1 XRE family transcriptional regulator [Roseburia sp. 1XD42-69]
MGNDLENFDFLELGQAIQDAREKQRITREELAEELGISARHLQSIEKEGQYPSFRLFIQLVTMFHISVDQYIHPDSPIKKTTLRRRLDVLLDTFDDAELTIIAGTAQGICKAKKQPED